MGRFSAVCPASFFVLAAVCFSFVSEPWPYPFFRLYLPLCYSFPFTNLNFIAGGAAGPPVPRLPISFHRSPTGYYTAYIYINMVYLAVNVNEIKGLLPMEN